MSHFRNSGGFATILAVLLMAFLVIIGSGILFLFMAEHRTNRSLFDGLSAFAAAEAGTEYALLKIRNHREGFQDALSFEAPEGRMETSAEIRRPSAWDYEIRSFATFHTGTLAPGEMEIFPLFFDKGHAFSTTAGRTFKNPNAGSSDVEETADFVLATDGEVSWNLVGSDDSGATSGLSGTGSAGRTVGNSPGAAVSEGVRRYDLSGETVFETQTLGDFLSAYRDSYLVVTNPGTSDVKYSLQSSNGFAMPEIAVSAAGKSGKSVARLEFSENRSRHFDALRYSLFDAGN